MSAFIVSNRHIDYLLNAGLRLPGMGSPLRWTAEEPDASEYERGSPWGSGYLVRVAERLRELTEERAIDVGRMLLLENYRSVHYRYDEEPAVEEKMPYEFEASSPFRKVDPVAVLKAIACFEYQACEHPDWSRSEAASFCESLRAAAIRRLPGYDEASWEVTA